MKKWQDQSWQFVIHTSMTLFELHIMATHDHWWDNPTDTILSYHPSEYDYDPAAKLFCLTQLAIWMYTAFSCKWMEERHKDYLVMMTHHVATVATVFGCLYANQLGICVIALYVHDVSDVFVDILKLLNYLKLEGPAGYFLDEMWFCLTIVGWVYWRLYLHPTHVMNATFYGYHSKWGDEP